jgi:DNA-binding transcriptional LysR family regulator
MIVNLYHWSRLELRHVVALQTVVEARSFWAAADRLDTSQSALSQQIAALEHVVGARLIERSRGRRSIALTEAGEIFLRHATAIVARLSAAHTDFTALAQGAAGTLRVGTFESSGTRILPLLLRSFRKAWPKVDIRLTEAAKDDQLLALVERGDLDVSFALFPLPDGPFEAVELMRDPYVLVVPADSPLAARSSPPTLAQIQRLPLVSHPGGRSVDQVEAYLRSRGMAMKVTFRANYNGTVQGLVAAGEGAALAPALTVDGKDARVKILGPIRDVPPRIITMAWHRDRYRSPAARAFVEIAQQVCVELSRPTPVVPSRRSPRRPPRPASRRTEPGR